MQVQERFVHYVAENELFDQGDRLLIGVSGGRDSVLLLHLCVEGGFEVGIAHVNFGLRGEASDADEALVRFLAEEYSIPCYVKQVLKADYESRKGDSVQMAARDIRYSWFEELRLENGYSRILVAHQQDDLAETVLFNLARGTGMRGLHGIRPRKDKLVRPLLFMNREAVDQAVNDFDLFYRDDETNFSKKYSRNKIRIEAIPALKEVNSAAVSNIALAAERIASLEAFADAHIADLRERLFQAMETGFQISIEEIMGLEPLNFCLYEMFRPFGFSGPVLGDLMRNLKQNGERGKSFYSSTHRLDVDRDFLYLLKLPDKASRKGIQKNIFIAEDVRSVSFNGWNLRMYLSEAEVSSSNNADRIRVDESKLVYPLCLRYWEEGDRFQPLGLSGQKKLGRFFISEKIPLHQKSQVPVLVNGDGKIIWVIPLRMDDRFKIRPNTQKVLTFDCSR